MDYLVIYLFVLSLCDQHLTTQLDRDGPLVFLLQRKVWRRQRTIVRVAGGAGVLLFLLLWWSA